MRQLLNGNEATALAARLAGIEVFASYPITPAAPAMEQITRFISEGTLKAQFIRVESDHSALAAAVGAALAGARPFIVTNSQGLAYMSEVLYHVSGLRLPVVMAVVNRALAAPHSRFSDHGDAIAQEACGWIQLFCENNQEVLDTMIQAFRIAEDERVRLPVMVHYESYIQSHTREVAEIPETEAVARFLSMRRQPALLDVNNPQAINVPTGPDLYMDYKYQQDTALQEAGKVIAEASAEYAAFTDRNWGGSVQGYRLEDAEMVMVTMGSLVGTCREAVDVLRERGCRAGLLKVRAFRPFPDNIGGLLSHAAAVIVLDKNIVYGSGGALAREVRAALYGTHSALSVYSFILGLGGRDVSTDDICELYSRTQEKVRTGQKPASYEWYGLTHV